MLIKIKDAIININNIIKECQQWLDLILEAQGKNEQ